MKLTAKAAQFAREAHGRIDQRRKYTEEPYIVHPEAVSKIVASITDDEKMIAAAWLHDVVEDTPVSIEEIKQHFGDTVRGLVHDLTNVAQKEDGNRAERKRMNREHSAKADPRAKTVKLEDVIDNLSDLEGNDPGFARIYAAEKRLLLDVLKEGHPDLYRQAEELVERLERL